VRAVDEARQYHARREELRRQRREMLRQQRYALVRRAVERIAPAYPAIHAVYLFGSLVHPGRFNPRSDVDVAVDCDDLDEESHFWRALESALQIDVDLRPRQGAVAWAVATQGECIYERAVPAP
jgi:predicted nucleotidyltransferase